MNFFSLIHSLSVRCYIFSRVQQQRQQQQWNVSIMLGCRSVFIQQFDHFICMNKTSYDFFLFPRCHLLAWKAFFSLSYYIVVFGQYQNRKVKRVSSQHLLFTQINEFKWERRENEKRMRKRKTHYKEQQQWKKAK